MLVRRLGGLRLATGPAARAAAGAPGTAAAALHRAATAATALCEPFDQTPTLWWPATHSWCVASEIDFHSTYVGGPRGLVDRLVDDERIEALEVAIGAHVTD